MKQGKNNIIEKGVQIGEGTEIGDMVILRSGTKIGKNCFIGSMSIIEGSELKDNVHIQGRVRIGKGCIIHNNVVIKYDAVLTSYVTVDEGAFIGVKAVTLGSETDRVQIGGTYIGKRVYLCGGSYVSAGLKIPDDTILGCLSFLKTVGKSGTYVGIPAKRIK